MFINNTININHNDKIKKKAYYRHNIDFIIYYEYYCLKFENKWITVVHNIVFYYNTKEVLCVRLTVIECYINKYIIFNISVKLQ